MNGPARHRWVLATGNPGKVREFAAALGPAAVDLDAAGDLGLRRFPPETGATYEENALLKAGFAAAELRRVAVADDSGLEVDALGGGPGVWSARFAEICAKRYLDAVYRRKREVLIGGRELMMVHLRRFFPGLFYRIAGRIKPS